MDWWLGLSNLERILLIVLWQLMCFLAGFFGSYLSRRRRRLK